MRFFACRVPMPQIRMYLCGKFVRGRTPAGPAPYRPKTVNCCQSAQVFHGWPVTAFPASPGSWGAGDRRECVRIPESHAGLQVASAENDTGCPPFDRMRLSEDEIELCPGMGTWQIGGSVVVLWLAASYYPPQPGGL